ncbi:hypothetical protein AMJ86_07700 [bacterium SM23_57]|nr:MAG: hypothetical protein AMJ86_07700 [bacterium SM23_57]
MKQLQISSELARRLALHSQLLDGGTELPEDKEGVAQTIEKLGYIQIDTINVIERAHHHTLWTRRPDYHQDMLHQLQAVDRRVFEYWGHAASYLPMSDYRYYLPKMRNFMKSESNWWRNWMKKHGHLMKPVLERIRNEGPLSSKDFEPPPGSTRGPWWDWKPTKAALEILFWQGDLMISERRNFQRVYDITERVLPQGIDTRDPDEDELGQFLVRRALSAYGVATEKEIRDHIHAANKNVISKSINDLIVTGKVIPINIEGNTKTPYYTLTESIEKSANLTPTASQVFLLSPFDNLIIQRNRTTRLFGFDYALECYVPPAKRKYGYYVLPILWGEQFVGRLDPKVDRRKKTLIIRHLILEPDFSPSGEFLSAFVGKLSDFSRFNQCEKIVLEKTTPSEMKEKLQRLMN